MSETLTHTTQTASVQATINYAVDTGEKPVSETGGADGLVRTYQ